MNTAKCTWGLTIAYLPHGALFRPECFAFVRAESSETGEEEADG